ncbi:PQQ-like beta-propeller repeat protein [Natronomonas gomsonensis]|uniref:outer membrane protein assembly factor BamB family protein n=1 Tax=Natronomonas gomsonensis TaxID=1046043 RepID=UPI0020CA7CF7|nr:PQQ-binding-like beta-propeller repeat protein [Natronomonas gomsonensis]MCY4729164.1 PQQ-like beta-propeller repeat protein [Natronomonas gomsonensis]
MRYCRRTVLSALAAGAVGVAGCSGDQSPDGNGGTDGGTPAESSPSIGGVTGTWQTAGGPTNQANRIDGVSGRGPEPPFTRVWSDGDINTGFNLIGPDGRFYNHDSSSQSGGITVVDAATGSDEWSTSIDDGSDAIGRPLWVDEDAVICSYGAVSPSDGSRLWERVNTDRFRGQCADATGLYGQGFDAGQPRPVRKRGVDDGKQRWSYDLSEVQSARPKFVADGRLFARGRADGDEVTLTLDAETGRDSRIFDSGAPAAVDNRFYYLRGGGSLSAVDPDSGETAWDVATEPYNFVVGDERFYYLDRSAGSILAREKASGDELWSVSLGVRTVAFLFGAGDRIYVSGVQGGGTSEESLTAQTTALTPSGEQAWSTDGFLAQFVTEQAVYGSTIQSDTPVMGGYVPQAE